MSASLRIATPLGPLEVVVDGGDGVDGVAGTPRESLLPSGARVLVWQESGGLVVDALATKIKPSDTAGEAPPEMDLWGIEWRLHALTSTGDLTVSALLPKDAVTGWHEGDENLVTVLFDTPDWVLAIGGPDEEWLSQLAGAGRLPASWRELRAPEADTSAGRGLVWRLGALKASESARMHVAVAWCRTGHRSGVDAPAMAVDVSPSDIRTAAGVVTRTEARRGARGT